jgi:hypothetical protein
MITLDFWFILGIRLAKGQVGKDAMCLRGFIANRSMISSMISGSVGDALVDCKADFFKNLIV